MNFWFPHPAMLPVIETPNLMCTLLFSLQFLLVDSLRALKICRELPMKSLNKSLANNSSADISYEEGCEFKDI